MDGNDFIILAGRLAVMPQDEAAHRTAISRAYYGVFHVARSFLLDLGFRPVGNANVHAFGDTISPRPAIRNRILLHPSSRTFNQRGTVQTTI
jgi:uncharacterized protein (UPF0332 family)